MLKTIPASDLDEMVNLSTLWRLPGVLRHRFSDADALIVDEAVAVAFDDRFSIKGYQHLTPAAALEGLPRGKRRFLVLSLENELGLVRRLRRLYPDRSFASVVYDFAPMQASHNFTFKQLSMGPKHALEVPINMLITLPGADGEFLAKAMRAASMPEPIEYINPAHVAYAQWGGRFDPVRLFYQAIGWSKADQKFAVHMQTDVLFPMVEQGLFELEKLKSLVETGDVRIIYLSRRDKLFQAGLLAAMERTPFRSPWHIHKDFKGRPKRLKDHARPYQIMQDLLDMEIKLESWFASIEAPVKMITLESLVNSPQQVLAEISQYLGVTADLSVELPSYKSLFDRFPWLVDSSRAFRRDLIDRLGLHVNEFGSFVSDGDALID